jgi:hypothetical protein
MLARLAPEAFIKKKKTDKGQAKRYNSARTDGVVWFAIFGSKVLVVCISGLALFPVNFLM